MTGTRRLDHTNFQFSVERLDGWDRGAKPEHRSPKQAHLVMQSASGWPCPCPSCPVVVIRPDSKKVSSDTQRIAPRFGKWRCIRSSSSSMARRW